MLDAQLLVLDLIRALRPLVARLRTTSPDLAARVARTSPTARRGVDSARVDSARREAARSTLAATMRLLGAGRRRGLARTPRAGGQATR